MIPKVKLRSDRIRTLMAEKRITQKALGALINVHPQTIHYMLRREKAALEDAQMIAVALDVDLQEIVKGPA